MTNDRILLLTFCYLNMEMCELRLVLYNSFKILWQLKIFSIRLLRV